MAALTALSDKRRSEGKTLHRPVSPCPPTAGAPRTDPGPALVVTSFEDDIDAASLRLLLSAVFETPVLDPVQETALQHICARPELWGDRGLLLDGLGNYFLGLLSSRSEDENVVTACLEALCVHRDKTRDSAHSYSTEGKPNPGAVFWPNPTDPKHPGSLFDTLPFVHTYPFLTKATPIGSAGSCFAMEIAHRLQAEGFNYVVTEPHLVSENGLACSCAAWGIIFNTPSFRQLAEKAFDLRVLPKILWARRHEDVIQYLDPFREDIIFDSVEAYEAGYESHLEATRQAFLRSEVFVFTLGMNEIWRMKGDRSVFSRAPWGIMPDLVEKCVLTVEENVQELQRMLDILRHHNPRIKIILSVSPVPLHATFRGADTHILAANCHSKSVLRVVAEEFVARNTDVYYFPSYETVMYCTPDAWDADQRHVSRQAVDRVMRLFHHMFVPTQPWTNHPRRESGSRAARTPPDPLRCLESETSAAVRRHGTPMPCRKSEE